MRTRASALIATPALFALTLAALSGCSGASSATTPTETATPTQSPTASPTPSETASPSPSETPIPEQTANPDTEEMRLLAEVVKRSIEAAIAGGLKEVSAQESIDLTVTRIWHPQVSTSLLDFDDQPLRGIEVYTDALGANDYTPSTNFDTDPDFWALGGFEIDISRKLVSAVSSPFPNQFDVELTYITKNGTVKKQELKVLHEDGFIVEIRATKAQTVWIETGMVVTYTYNLPDEDMAQLMNALRILKEQGY